MSRAWDGNWNARILSRVWKRGFQTVTEFADSRPLDTLSGLADELGREDVAPIQLEFLLRQEAEERGTVERFARSLLVRRFRERVPDGWAISDNYEFESERAGAYASWIGGLDDRDHEAAERVWDAFEVLDLPRGWLPSGPDDPVLDQIFAGVTLGAAKADEQARKDGEGD
jgi:hypothetical protein